jgi:hypothetical protein
MKKKIQKYSEKRLVREVKKPELVYHEVTLYMSLTSLPGVTVFLYRKKSQ